MQRYKVPFSSEEKIMASISLWYQKICLLIVFLPPPPMKTLSEPKSCFLFLLKLNNVGCYHRRINNGEHYNDVGHVCVCIYVYVCVCVCVKWSESHSVMSDSLRPMDYQACQTSLSMEFSRPEYWSGWPFPSPGGLPNPGIEPRLPHCRWILYQLSYQGSPRILEWVA